MWPQFKAWQRDKQAAQQQAEPSDKWDRTRAIEIIANERVALLQAKAAGCAFDQVRLDSITKDLNALSPRVSEGQWEALARAQALLLEQAEPAGDERARCQHCHGLGIAAIIGRTEVTCAACDGVGYWHGEESGYGDIDCDACGGTGKQPPTDTEAVARALCESVGKRSDRTAGELWTEYRSEFMEDASAASAVIAAQSGQRAGVVDWIDAAVQNPPDATPVLVSGFEYNDPHYARYYDVCRFEDGAWVSDVTSDMVYTPTHWMAIAAAPTPAAQGDQP